MRTIIGYRDGKAIWSDNVPGRARVQGGSINGSIVVSDSPPPRKHEAQEKQLRGTGLEP